MSTKYIKTGGGDWGKKRKNNPAGSLAPKEPVGSSKSSVLQQHIAMINSNQHCPSILGIVGK